MTTAPAADQTRAKQLKLFDGPFGAIYSFYIEHPWLPRTIGRLIWGGNARLIYDSFGVIRGVSDGGIIIDAPCGSGVAFRGLGAEQRVRYLAVDLSHPMLERARSNATRRGLVQIEFHQGDAATIPVPDASADLFLSHGGLHCFPDPQAAVIEAARCLRGGGRLIGTTFLLGNHLRQRLLIRPHRGGFGPVGTREDLQTWLATAGFREIELRSSGPLTLFLAAAD